MEEATFECVLSDIKMPDVNGVKLYRDIKAKRPDLPVMLMTAYSSDKLVDEGLEEGAIAVLNKPLGLSLLLSFFSLLRKGRSVVIVDDDLQFCKTLGDILQKRGFGVTQITDPHDIVEQIDPNEKVILLDMKLNSINGLDVLQEIREQYPNIPVILVTGYRAEMAEAIEGAIELKVYACLYKPLWIEKLFQILVEIHHEELSQFLRQSRLTL